MPAAIASFIARRSLRCFLCSRGAASTRLPRPQARRPVQVERVAFQKENASRDFVGVVRARYETDLGFRVAGKITARIVNVGDRVHVGDVIARLDPEDLEACRSRAPRPSWPRRLEPRADRVRRAALQRR